MKIFTKLFKRNQSLPFGSYTTTGTNEEPNFVEVHLEYSNSLIKVYDYTSSHYNATIHFNNNNIWCKERKEGSEWGRVNYFQIKNHYIENREYIYEVENIVIDSIIKEIKKEASKKLKFLQKNLSFCYITSNEDVVSDSEKELVDLNYIEDSNPHYFLEFKDNTFCRLKREGIVTNYKPSLFKDSIGSHIKLEGDSIEGYLHLFKEIEKRLDSEKENGDSN